MLKDLSKERRIEQMNINRQVSKKPSQRAIKRFKGVFNVE